MSATCTSLDNGCAISIHNDAMNNAAKQQHIVDIRVCRAHCPSGVEHEHPPRRHNEWEWNSMAMAMNDSRFVIGGSAPQ